MPCARLRPRDLAKARKNTWVKLAGLIVDYAAYREQGRIREAAVVRDTIREEPFPAVLTWMLYLSQLGTADVLFVEGQGKACLKALRDARYREIHDWIDQP